MPEIDWPKSVESSIENAEMMEKMISIQKTAMAGRKQSLCVIIDHNRP